MKLSSRAACAVFGAAFLGLAGCGGSTVLDAFADPEDAGEETASEGGAAETSAGDDTGSTDEDAPVASDTGVKPDGTTTTDTATGGDAIVAVDSVVVVDSVAVDARPDGPVLVDAGGDVRACTTYPQAAEFGGHCYIPLDRRTWTVAQSFCRDTIGGHLVTINTAAEQTFLNGFIGGNTDRWIGLAKEPGASATPANYKWITGETSTYANWNAATNEPNGTGSCVRMISGGAWADQSCTESEYSICERE